MPKELSFYEVAKIRKMACELALELWDRKIIATESEYQDAVKGFYEYLIEATDVLYYKT